MLVQLDKKPGEESVAVFNSPSFNPKTPFAPITPHQDYLAGVFADPGLSFPQIALDAGQLALVTAENALNNALHQQQYILYDLASRVGVLSPFVGAAQNALKGFDVILDDLDADVATAEAVTTAIGVAGTTLSAIPTIYTQIAGAVVSIGLWIADLFIKYKAEIPTMHPAQEYSRETDVDQFNLGVRDIMKATFDWTPIFSPRFQGELAGQVRTDRNNRTVIAFAPGDGRIAKVDVTGRGKNRKVKFPNSGVFNPSGGLGMIPGGQRILSVYQVTPMEAAVGPSHGHATIYDPRCGSTEKATGLDVGSWYPVTAQGAMSLWDFVWQRGAAMYTIDVPACRSAWRNYFADIWRGVEKTWGQHAWRGDRDDYGWGCGFWENALQELVRNYTVGVEGQIGGALSWGPSNLTGEQQHSLSPDADEQWEAANAYNRIIEPALDKLEEAQIWYLEKTTMAAYLPIKGGADADPLDQARVLGAFKGGGHAMRKLFNDARHGILNGPRKFDVRLRDVIDKKYRQEIRNHGGGTDALELGFSARLPGEPKPWKPEGGLGLGVPPPPPTVHCPPVCPPTKKAWPYLVGGGVAVSATALAYFFWDDLARAAAAGAERLPPGIRRRLPGRR